MLFVASILSARYSIRDSFKIFVNTGYVFCFNASLSTLFLQVLATVGDKHQGGTHILYDPSLSERGALVCVARAPRKKSVDDFQPQPMIHNPHALPLFRDQPSRKRQREKILKDPLKSHKPEVPMTGPGHGGRVGTTKGSLLTQYLLKVIPIIPFFKYPTDTCKAGESDLHLVAIAARWHD